MDDTPLRRQLLITAVILFLTAIVIITLFNHEETITTTTMQREKPSVSIITAAPQTYSLTIEARGLVEPKRQLNLMGQVLGTVTYISDKFAAGNTFNKGDILLTVDTHYVELELQKANVAYQQASLHELEVKAQSNDEDTANNPQFTLAHSTTMAALAGLQLAQQQLNNTKLQAPFDGRVITRVIQEQEQLVIGRPIGQIYATDTLQLRIALTPEQLTLLGNIGKNTHSITASNDNNKWQGYLIRSESMIAANRMVYVIAEIHLEKSEEQPLLGSLLSVSIQSLPKPNLIKIPLTALYNNNSVWVVNHQQQLYIQPINIIFQNNNEAYINNGIATGDNIVINPLADAYNGMPVVINHSIDKTLTP